MKPEMGKNMKGKISKGSIIGRCYDLLLFLHQQHTAVEIGERLGITKYCAYEYLAVVGDRFPLMSRKRLVKGKGMNPQEHWIDYLGRECDGVRVPLEEENMVWDVLFHIVKYGFNGEVDG